MNDNPKTPDSANGERDATASMNQWSQVTPEKKRFRIGDKFSLIIIVAVLLVMGGFFFQGRQTSAKTAQSADTSGNAVSDELAENLARLRDLQHTPAPASAPAAPISPPANVAPPAPSKQYLARQNAPTNMFSADSAGLPAANTQASQVKNDAVQATLAGHNPYADFANQAIMTTAVSAQKIAHPRYTIASGEFLHAVLETAIQSDLPGQIRAVVSQPVYAYVGEMPLIPAGSRLIGQYSSAVAQGQNRVFVIWNRVILPNGVTAQLNSPGVDAIGQSGQGADNVNTHFFTRFGQAALLSIIGAGVANTGVNSQDQYNSAAQYRMAIAQSFQQSANASLQNSLPTRPTLSIHQGAAINVFVAHDIDFYAVMNAKQ